MKLSSCFCRIIMYCIICEEYFLNIVSETIIFKEKEPYSCHDSNLNKDFNNVNNNRLIREEKNIKNTKDDQFLNFVNFNQNNKSNQPQYGLNFTNENKFHESLVPETFNSIDPNVILHDYELNMSLFNKSKKDKEFQEDAIKKDLTDIKLHKNFGLILNELNNRKDLNFYHSNGELINNFEEIFDKSPYYETNLYVNSVKKPVRNNTERNIKDNEVKYLQKNETNNIYDLLRMYLSNNLGNVNDDENKLYSDKTSEQEAKLTGTNPLEKIKNFNNILNFPQINTKVFENILSNLSTKVLQDNNSLLQPDISNIKDNNFETAMNSASNLGISNKGVVVPEETLMIQKNNTDQKNLKNDFSLQKFKNIENLSNENTIDKKMNYDDYKNDNYDHFFQELQKNFTKMKSARSRDFFPDYDINNYHTGSIRPQLVLHNDLSGNFNFRNMFNDNITRHRNNNEILEYLASNNEQNQKTFVKNNSETNSSGNLGNYFVPTNYNKTSSYDFSTLNSVTNGIPYGSYLVNYSSEILKGFLPSPPSNSKVNIKDPKLIENLRKIDLSLLSYPPAFNYGMPINKHKKMFISQRINKRSFPMLTLHLENESNENKTNNAPVIDDNNLPLTGNLCASLLPGILLQPDHLDEDTFQTLNNNLLDLISNYPNNSSNKNFHNENYAYPKTFIIGNTSGGQLNLTKPVAQLSNPIDSKLTKINSSEILNSLPNFLIHLNEPPNITQDINNDSNFIKMIGSEKGLKELVNIPSENLLENLSEVSTSKLYYQSNFKTEDFIHNEKNKSKFGKMDYDKVINADIYINSSDLVTEHNESKWYTNIPEFKRVTLPDGEHNWNSDVILQKNYSNISIDIPNKNQIAHVKLVGFVLEKNNSGKPNEINDNNNTHMLLSNQVFKKASSYEPINQDINVVKSVSKPNDCMGNSNFNQNNLTDYQKNMSSFNKLLNISDANLIEKLISVLQKNLENQTKQKSISVK